jgi:SAM-dependent methyltransferase
MGATSSSRSMTGEPRYDRIGRGYSATRRPDPRIARLVTDALDDSRSVVNVGAGTGSYEPGDRAVVAVEPSIAMVRQRPSGSASVVRATAGALPFARGAFDGALAVLTVHHWTDASAGLAELRRVASGTVVVLTFDHDVHCQQWIVTDYLPDMAGLDGNVPSPDEITRALGGGTVKVVPVPADCVDGFCHAFWARPAAYLDPAVRAGISGIARLPRETVAKAMARLDDDLSTGRWLDRHGSLVGTDAIDVGYRLVISP